MTKKLKKKKKMLSIIKFSFKGSYRIIIKARYGTIKYAADFVYGRIRFMCFPLYPLIYM